MSSLLPLLFILACPLMMLLMMRGMGHGSRRDGRAGQGPDGGAPHVATSEAVDGDLHAIVAELEESVEELKVRINELEQSDRGGSLDAITGSSLGTRAR